MFNKVPVYKKGEAGVFAGITFEDMGNGFCKGMALEKNLAYLKLVCGATPVPPEGASVEEKSKRVRRTKAQIEADKAAVVEEETIPEEVEPETPDAE